MRIFRFAAWFFGGIFVLLLLLGGLFVARQRLGPTGPVPARSPVVVHNERAAALAENAADEYLRAVELLKPEIDLRPPDPNENRIKAEMRIDASRAFEQKISDAFVVTTPMPPEIPEWIAEHGAVFDAVYAGAACEECLLPLDTTHDAIWGEAPLTELRLIAKLLIIRARMALERGELEYATADLMATARLGRHLFEQPTIIMQLAGAAILSIAADEIIPPLKSDEFPLAARLAHARAFAGFKLRPRDRTEPLIFDRDRAVNGVHQMAGIRAGGPAFMLPKARVAGEYDRLLAPTLALYRAPLQTRLDPNSPERALAEALPEEANTKWAFVNLPLASVLTLMPSMTRACKLGARIELQVRGTRLALILFIYRAERGEWPASLEALLEPGVAESLGVELDPNEIIDAFVGEPFVYRLTDDGGMLLYSRGYDKDDDGGVHNDAFGRASPSHGRPVDDGDYVFWPPSVREKASLEADGN